MPPKEDLSGQTYGLLTVVSYSHHDGYKRVWTCRCSCGQFTYARGNDLKTGQKKSCGCLKIAHAISLGKAKMTHGKTHSREWNSWMAMRQRCTSERDIGYKNYGGRGISYCPRWESFENFLMDMGPRPPGMTLERKDNDGDYEPNNCKWATALEQRHNQRRSKS